MRKIIAVILVAVFVTGCAGEVITREEDVASQILHFDEHKLDMEYSIIVDADTDVCYLINTDIYGGGMTVLLNPDGTPRLWKDIENESKQVRGERMVGMKDLDIKQESLQIATCKLRNELMKKGDWYDGFVASISSSLREIGVYEPDIEDIAKRVLNRIIGLEE